MLKCRGFWLTTDGPRCLWFDFWLCIKVQQCSKSWRGSLLPATSSIYFTERNPCPEHGQNLCGCSGYLPSQPTVHFGMPSAHRSWTWGIHRQVMSCWEHREIGHRHSPEDGWGIRQTWWNSSACLVSVFQGERMGGHRQVAATISAEIFSMHVFQHPKMGFGVLGGEWLELRSSWMQVWGEDHKMNVQGGFRAWVCKGRSNVDHDLKKKLKLIVIG